MLPQTTATASFFHAMAPILTANILTVAFVYCFVKITQKELRGEEDGRLTYLWLIVMVLSFMLYGLYTWGVYPFKRESALPASPAPARAFASASRRAAPA